MSEHPKVFISYSWSNPDYEERILNIAKNLREDGIDAILDKWNLKEGDDAYAFMESMVNDTEIEKVIIFSDKLYADKANKREGGVGTETQIISSELYSKREVNRFVLIITERDDAGNACIPTYYKSRIYIDFSDPDKESSEYDRLLRWIYDKPLYVKPDMGEMPIYLVQENSISLGTAPAYKRVLDAITNSKSNQKGTIQEYLQIFSDNLSRFQINVTGGEYDDAVIENIELFKPYRDEYIEFLDVLCNYNPDTDYIKQIHSFFERLLLYIMPWSDAITFDNYRFIAHELFLYTVAILIKHEQFSDASYLMKQKYYYESERRGGELIEYTEFLQHLKTLENRNKRLTLRKLSLHSEILKERNVHCVLSFRNLMQADFILYLSGASTRNRWWPYTLVYLDHFEGPFEVFLRAESNQYFDNMKCLLAIESRTDLDLFIQEYETGKRHKIQFGFDAINPRALIGYEKLATKP